MWLIIDESCLRIAGETTMTACCPSADARSDAEFTDLIIFSANALSVSGQLHLTGEPFGLAYALIQS